MEKRERRPFAEVEFVGESTRRRLMMNRESMSWGKLQECQRAQVEKATTYTLSRGPVTKPEGELDIATCVNNIHQLLPELRNSDESSHCQRRYDRYDILDEYHSNGPCQ